MKGEKSELHRRHKGKIGMAEGGWEAEVNERRARDKRAKNGEE